MTTIFRLVIDNRGDIWQANAFLPVRREQALRAYCEIRHCDWDKANAQAHASPHSKSNPSEHGLKRDLG